MFVIDTHVFVHKHTGGVRQDHVICLSLQQWHDKASSDSCLCDGQTPRGKDSLITMLRRTGRRLYHLLRLFKC